MPLSPSTITCMTDATLLPIGPFVTPDGRSHLERVVNKGVSIDLMLEGVRALDGGMETTSSPYVVLVTLNGTHLVIVERLNADGEFAPHFASITLPNTPGFERQNETVSPADRDMLFRAAKAVPDEVDAVTVAFLADAGLISADLDAEGFDELDDVIWELFYCFRDIISPLALI